MKRYEIFYTASAAKAIRKLPPDIREICGNAVERLASDPYEGKPLKRPFEDLRSFRTSSYRIIYKIEEKKIAIIAVAVGHRKDIYEKLKRLLDS
ncbi:MAG TPA: type II toxin-antitoxin system RelE/ParE family toxin [bacterium]|nr:type II toxin-antitoxin system RelE/ParE family toxin [bacterium]